MTSVALVVLDTLRKDAFDERFGWLPGRRFENAVSTSHWTVPVHASLFCGRYPSELGVHAGSTTLSCPESTLAERLSEAGYTTRAYSCNPYVSKTFRFDRGFDRFSGSWRLDAFDPALFDWNEFIDRTRGEGAKRFLRALYRCVTEDCDTVRSLRYGLDLKLRDLGVGEAVVDDGGASATEYARETRFGDREFLFVNLMEAHAPYHPPKSYRSVEPPAYDNTLATVEGTDVDADLVRQAYDDSVKYLSDVYRELFAELRASFDLVVTLADHGELFGEHGAWEHVYGVYPELTRIPLVLSGDRFEGTETATVSLLDIYATVLDAAGLEPDGDRRGRSLLDPIEDEPALAEYHGLQSRKREKLAANDIPEATIAAYNEACEGVGFAEGFYGWVDQNGFDSVGNPGERDPESVLTELISGLDRREVTGEDGALSESLEQHLRDLGYA